MQRDFKVNGVVTSTRHYGELHKLVNLLTPDYGLIKAVIYGGRKGKNTSLAPLFSYGTFQIYNNPVKKEYSITEAECLFTASELTSDIKLNAAASYICELVNKIETDNPKQIYELVVFALTHLESGTFSTRKILIDFTWKFLVFSGLGFDMKNCPSCGKKLGANEVLNFLSTIPAPVCTKCCDTDRITLPPGARRYLEYTFPMDFEQALKVELFENSQIRIQNFLISWISVFCPYINTVKSGLL